MRVKSLLPALGLVFFGYTCLAQTPEQNSGANVLNETEYKLSPAAVAAGIDGKLSIGLTINADGKASDVRIYGGPMWPCGARNPGSEIDDVRKTVKQHILGMKFSPELKGGKARSVSAEITFLLSGRFKTAAKWEQVPGNANTADPVLIDVGPINNRAVTLPRAFYSGPKIVGGGVTLLQILVDENGNVTSAGGFKGNPTLLVSVRDAACEAKFKPAILNGKPVWMTGILTHIFR